MNAGLVGLFGDYDDDESSTSTSQSHLGPMGACGITNINDTKHDDESINATTGECALMMPINGNTNLPPEVERGNIEYKLKLIDPTPVRFEHLVTQMKWRLQEGLGEAIYEIGVSDDGYLKVRYARIS